MVIDCANVSKSFSRHTKPAILRGYVSQWLKQRGTPRPRFQALKRVSFQVRRGDSLAIIGSNGAGKSTLLSLIAGLAKPDSGSIRVEGRIAPLLELGSGFHHDLTGTENVWLNASLLGLTRKETNRLFDTIVEFSGVGDFINEPLRTYSSGMVLRLAFSVATNTNPDILLIDEVLAVGDQAFQAKCFERIRQLRREGRTLVCVSHASGMVQQICDRAIWLDHGELLMDSTVSKVAEAHASHGPPATQGHFSK